MFFMNIGDSILSFFRILFFPFLEPRIFFSKSRAEERVTRAGMRCKISRVPGEIWLHHFYCPFLWYTVLRCPHFPFIFIFPSVFLSKVWLSPHRHFSLSDLDAFTGTDPRATTFHFVIIFQEYCLRHCDSGLLHSSISFIYTPYLFIYFKILTIPYVIQNVLHRVLEQLVNSEKCRKKQMYPNLEVYVDIYPDKLTYLILCCTV
jgi:hypothetical protein